MGLGLRGWGWGWNSFVLTRKCTHDLQSVDSDPNFNDWTKKELKILDVDFQLVPPHNHQRNQAERAIRTFKNHFIAILCATDKNFPMSQWDELLHQAELTLNLMRASRINPRLSAWPNLKASLTSTKPPWHHQACPSYSMNKQDIDLHGAHMVLTVFTLDRHLNTTDATGPTSVTPKAFVLVTPLNFFRATSGFHLATKDNAIIAARELATALTKPLPAGPFQVSDEQLAAIRQLSAIFYHTTTPEPQPAPAARPRVPTPPPETQAALPRVPIPSSSIPPTALLRPPLTATPTSPPRQPKRRTPVVTPPRNHPESTP